MTLLTNSSAGNSVKVGRDRWARRWIHESLSSFAAGPAAEAAALGAVPPYLKHFLFCCLAITTLLGLPACSDSHATTTAHSEPAPASTYKAGHGLQLTATARKFIALQTGEVAIRSFAGANAATAIPAEALLRTIKGDFVFVANGAWFLRTPVQIGASDGAWFEVKDGLYEGDTIVTHGTQALWLAELQAVNGGVGCADGH